MYSLSMAWERLGGDLLVTAMTVVIAYVLIGWLRIACHRTRRLFQWLLFATNLRTISSALAGWDMYYHGTLTQHTSPALTALAWTVGGLAVAWYRDEVAVRLPDNIARYLATERFLAGDQLRTFAEDKDKENLRRSKEILARTGEASASSHA